MAILRISSNRRTPSFPTSTNVVGAILGGGRKRREPLNIDHIVRVVQSCAKTENVMESGEGNGEDYCQDHLTSALSDRSGCLTG